MSWTVANNPLFLDLYRRHGRDWNFLGVISLRTEWARCRRPGATPRRHRLAAEGLPREPSVKRASA
ncbi:MAG: hypothetical protein DMD99_12725 [Candidatus Rokuibacteriota bacterium]|nr:MAG: hypothetical protein DMD99_12725 [Candidatus Rokubacteria bacterium]